MNIINTFIKYTADILVDTNTGLSGSKIEEHSSRYEYDLKDEMNPY